MKTLERLVIKYILKIIYCLSYIFKIKKRIVFATYRPDYMEGNYKYILDEIKKRDLDYECKILYEKPGAGLTGMLKYLKHMCIAEHYLATSEFFIVDDFYFPVYAVNKLRKGTEVVQVWHACGAFKKFALSTVDENYSNGNEYIKYIPIHTNYTHVTVTSKEVAKHYAAAFNMSEDNIDPIGVPRTDIFFDEKKKEEAKEILYKKYPKLKDKKIILYAPTFRGTGQSDANSGIAFDVDKVVNALGEDYVLAIKMHPFVKWRYEKESDKVVDMSDYKSINDILFITDILITDYSSTVFEFALLDKPMIFYADDLETYINDRDFYYEYTSFVPGPIVKTTDELVDLIKEDNYDLEKVRKFKEKFFDYTDGCSSKRFVDKIILKK
ncbi:CDP-glycerol glycerophosphotransferase family protein [Clostridium thermobutyricum]|uniref:CDP-glycerol glycerophosphotransferase family protein n=1 Tax=Clostridium thermobutyricum TaxID=29372 RepID=UPI0018A994B0|nr:CDP-glycerol glycerophosphotransferase family protein [Clostridium thermobutyricum]